MAKIDEKDLKELFSELKSDNREIAFQKLYMKYNKLIYGIAFSLMKNKEDAEDIVQIFFSKLYTMEKEKLPKDNHASWIYIVTKNEVITLLRKNKDNFDLDSIYEIGDNNEEINKIIDKVEFNRLINKLNNKEKEIISLKILTNLSFEEIAELLQKPVGTVKWRYYKGVHTLKLLLSNLAMFILTFTIGIRKLFNKNKRNEVIKVQIVNNAEENKEETINQGNSRVENTTNETLKQHPATSDNTQLENKIDEPLQNTITEDIQENNFNYIGIGIIGVSSIFLLMTIIFTIIFTKYQLKSKRKTSK